MVRATAKKTRVPKHAFAAGLAREHRLPSTLEPPYTVPAIFGSARAGDPLAEAVVVEAARRIAVHITPIAAVTDVELVSWPYRRRRR